MSGTTISSGVFALLALLPLTSAHGYLSSITANGKSYSGFMNDKAPGEFPSQVIGWTMTNPSNGPAAQPSDGFTDYSSPDIICGPQATNAPISAEAPAGSTVDLNWSGTYGKAWPHSMGIIMTYMANCNGDCAKVDKTQLKFFKTEQQGQQGDGKWALQKMIDQGSIWHTTIPSSIAPGNYVLRNELVNLDVAKPNDGSQKYPGPQSYAACINLKVTGGGSDNPQGTPGQSLYTSQNSMLNGGLDIYKQAASFKMPGINVYTAGSGSNANSGSSPGSAAQSAAPSASSSQTTFAVSASPSPSPSPSFAPQAPAAPAPPAAPAAPAAPAPPAGGSGNSPNVVKIVQTVTQILDVTTTVSKRDATAAPDPERVHRHFARHRDSHRH